jgi:hypothetical protein
MWQTILGGYMSVNGEPVSAETLDCELCIVGAGYAALNGLNAAAKYLAKGARVVVIDKNESWGGQWLHQYDFVRLHQPYRMFTAGDQPWALKRDPSYLASRREVLDHLGSVPSISAGELEVEPLFGHTYRSHRVQDGRVEVEVEPVAPGGRPRRVRAKRLLKGTGGQIEVLPPFKLSSTRVRTVAVSDPVLMSREFLESDAPVYVIGSGKTAMDTMRYLAQSRGARRRSLNIVIGSGMWFFLRDQLYPSGVKRIAQGTLAAETFLRAAELFDGQNESDVLATMAREKLMINVFGHAGNCRYGMLSLAERDEVLRSVDQVYRGHLVDVEGRQMIVREGDQQRSVMIAEGSWFINCTTHLKSLPHEAVLQDDGLVCAPQFILGFSGTSAYYATHLWFRDGLAAIARDLYRIRLDVEPRLRFAPEVAVMVMANMMQVAPRLPSSIPRQFQGDFNKWYPLHRQLLMLARISLNRTKILRKAEQVLKLRFSDPREAVN